MQSILPNIGATLSLILGLVAIVWPSKIETFVSIKGVGKEGKSEVRATYGGFFIGISFYAMITQTTPAFITLGCGWLCAAIVRSVTLLFGFATPKNIGGVVFEGSIGVLCIAAIFTSI